MKIRNYKHRPDYLPRQRKIEPLFEDMNPYQLIYYKETTEEMLEREINPQKKNELKDYINFFNDLIKQKQSQE